MQISKQPKLPKEEDGQHQLKDQNGSVVIAIPTSIREVARANPMEIAAMNTQIPSSQEEKVEPAPQEVTGGQVIAQHPTEKVVEKEKNEKGGRLPTRIYEPLRLSDCVCESSWCSLAP